MLNRRDFLKTVIGGSVLLGMPGCYLDAPAKSENSKRPNILLIMADDMGFSDVGCYGSEINTPNLDKLAQNGLRFSQFYNSARCCPTRASLLTGLYPHQVGIGHMVNNLGNDAYQGDLNNRCVTLAEVLKSAGYSTYMTGKWHVTNSKYTFNFDGKESKHNWPLQRGFDKFYGTIAGGGSYYDPTTLTRGNTFITPENDPEYKPDSFYYTDAISDNAVKFLVGHQQKKEDRPFFMYVAYTAPHWPLHAKPEDIAKYKGKYDKGYEPVRSGRYARQKQMGLIENHWTLSVQAGDWEKVSNKEWEARCMEVYAAMVDAMDQGIGKIIDELTQRNQLDNTIVLFLSDNGGCAEGLGRRDIPAWHLKGLSPMKPNEFQTKIWPPKQTRDGRPVLGGPNVMPGPENTYIAYGQNWANVSNTPFREYKHWVHEGGISTPLIVHWPKGIRDKGIVRHTPGHVIDLMATCVEIAGAKYPTTYNGLGILPMEGVSLVPVFNNKPLQREAIYWEHEGNRAVRMDRWKLVSKADRNSLIWDKTEKLPLDKWELYDMDQDRSETNDIASKHPDIVNKMAQLWQDWAERVHVLPKP
jgi:arylsulfatase